ncbi:AAA family ATPase [Pararobbsia alpina]|uniref:RecBCD enzyme subunit RecD n=1 Tax=Pararobbsia alpina TaxID=621374 RepID=A0A6S7BD65_9BURK|nr:AAA family ATPase [Pararobbsia alpina]CAB3784795.1 RecBCD enzyme subunit RecD [Pararobbsia alpina]
MNIDAFDAAITALQDEPAQDGASASYPGGEPRALGDDLAGTLAYGFARRLRWLAMQRRAPADAVRALARAAAEVSRATADGNVCIDLAMLADRGGESVGQWRERLLASGLVGRDASQPLVLDAHDRLYLARYYDYEQRLARSLGTLAANRTPLDAATLRARLDAFPGAAPAGEVDWQRVAAALSLDRRLTIISGGPGTGKTTTVVGILACLLADNPALRIALAAPTGKAAQRMQEALLSRAGALPSSLVARLPTRASTLHRLLGAGAGGQFRYRRGKPLPYDAIVVDEASMIDVAMGARLLDAIAPHARLIMLGDKDQLAAVEAGAVFAELSARPVLSEARLEVLAGALGVPDGMLREQWPGIVDSGGVARDVSDDAAQRHTGGSTRKVSRTVRDRNPDASTTAQLSLFDTPPVTEDMFTRAPREPHDVHAPETRGEYSEHEAHELLRRRAPLADCVVWLEKNYRFGLDSSIGRLSLAIRAGDTAAALNALSSEQSAAARLVNDAGMQLGHAIVSDLGQGFAAYASALSTVLSGVGVGVGVVAGTVAAATMQTDTDVDTDEDERAFTSSPSQIEYSRDFSALFDALNRFRVLCAVRSGPRGVERLNGLLSIQLRNLIGVSVSVSGKATIATSWFAGRPVMVTRNDYALGLFNGDIGIALPGGDGTLRVVFPNAEGTGWRAISPAALPPHETALALTVHKSQGSEFERAALVLPAQANRALTRELVYTAVTRAKLSIDIIGSAAVLAEAIETPTRRASGLALRLAEAGPP